MESPKLSPQNPDAYPVEIYPFKLYKPELVRRDFLIKYYSDLWGRAAKFSQILREIMREKDESLKEKKNQEGI